MNRVVVDLVEWQDATPSTLPSLKNVVLPDDSQTVRLVDDLARKGMLALVERRDGLAVRATSFVGSVNLGAITIRVRPKIEPRVFAGLVGYAFRLHRLALFSEHDVALAAPAFQDLLVQQLCREAAGIIARGLHRQYERQEEALANPRGRIDFGAVARQTVTRTALPCRHHARTEDALHNRVLLSGLVVAAAVCSDLKVRARALRLVNQLRLSVSAARLSRSTFRAIERASTRMTVAYEPAFALIRLILAGQGITPEPTDPATRLPGFLFDMNVLFQEAIGRFLREWLAAGEVEEQHRLRDVFTFEPAFNPRNRRAPTPRPDYIVRSGRQVIAVLDAKYRDLWEESLPPGMLYQLTVYALSHATCPMATILYPSTNPDAREARISIRDPLTGMPAGRVALRPVSLPLLADLVVAPRDVESDRRRRRFASYLAAESTAPNESIAWSSESSPVRIRPRQVLNALL